MIIRKTTFAFGSAAFACCLFAAPPAATAQAGPSTFSAAVASSQTPVLGIGSGRERGYSGALRAMLSGALDRLDLPFLRRAFSSGTGRYRWEPLYGSGAGLLPGEALVQQDLTTPETPGVWRLLMDGVTEPPLKGPFAVITRVPHSLKRNGQLNGYRIGRYPAEGSGRTDAYAPPEGFIEVTPDNHEMYVSEHFQLKNFLTKNQWDVWPKYIALDLRLIDKLELVMQELNAMGIRADRMHVMSGFRTPDYNGPGGDGRASLSRHTYGDAADVWVDNDDNGYMDDLNGDGRIDVNDAAVIRHAVDRIERRFPDLVGGTGIYSANSAHGPFIHIDTRGTRARW